MKKQIENFVIILLAIPYSIVVFFFLTVLNIIAVIAIYTTTKIN